jgi:hypothetical protein
LDWEDTSQQDVWQLDRLAKAIHKGWGVGQTLRFRAERKLKMPHQYGLNSRIQKWKKTEKQNVGKCLVTNCKK